MLVWCPGSAGPVGTNLLGSLRELEYLVVDFVSLTEAADLATPAGRNDSGQTLLPGHIKGTIRGDLRYLAVSKMSADTV